MKTIIKATMLLMLVMGSAVACPKGERPHGGTGSHHKGGYCSYDE